MRGRGSGVCRFLQGKAWGGLGGVRGLDRPGVSFESVPTEPTAVVWEDELVPRSDLEPENAKSVLHPSIKPEDLGTDRPVVTIGKPEVLRAHKSMAMPGFESVVPKDIYLVRLWCSFHDFATELRFDRAVFTVSLSSSDPGNSIVAHDLHPSEVLYKVERDVNVTLSPEVKFQQIEAKLGSFSYGFRYAELQPIIVAAGQGEAQPRWTFSSTKSRALQGGKAVHLLAAVPRGTPRADADLDLVAYVTKPGLVPLPMGIFAKRGPIPANRLEVRLW
jgi:hypothetical protein